MDQKDQRIVDLESALQQIVDMEELPVNIYMEKYGNFTDSEQQVARKALRGKK